MCSRAAGENSIPKQQLGAAKTMAVPLRDNEMELRCDDFRYVMFGLLNDPVNVQTISSVT